MDTQAVEILGRNKLINELLRAGLEIATPERDRGVDLVVYVDLSDKVSNFRAVPIQLKASSKCSFNLDRKYKKFPNMILAFVWNLDNDKESVTYALTYDEAQGICEKMGWTKTKSWTMGQYATTRPSAKLIDLLSEYKMTPAKWWKKVIDISTKI